MSVVKEALTESLKLMEEFPIRQKFSKAIVLIRLALEEIERERLQARVQDSTRAR